MDNKQTNSTSAKPGYGKTGATFRTVWGEELDGIAQQRLPPGAAPLPPDPEPDPEIRAVRMQLTGLAFSGGGIRSATFNLGLVQALSELRLLRGFDYLSTVSGGGYIGGWLSALILRLGKGRVEPVEAALAPPGSGDVKQEHSAIRYLREYSNYLTPRLGLLSADTLAAAATYLRNLYLNLTVMVLWMAALMTLPPLAVRAANAIGAWAVPDFVEQHRVLAQITLAAPYYFGLGLVFIGVAFFMIVRNMLYRPAQQNGRGWLRDGGVVLLIVLPSLLAAWLFAFGFYALGPGLDDYALLDWVRWGAMAYSLPWVAGWLVARVARAFGKEIDPSNRHRVLGMLAWAVLAGAAGGLMFYGLARLTLQLYEWMGPVWVQSAGPWWVAGLGTALMLKVFSLVVTLHIGLLGRQLSNDMREWLSRLGGWILSIAFGWLLLFTLCVLAPALARMAADSLLAAGGLGWAATTAAGVLIGKNPKVEAGARKWLVLAAPYVFVLGFLMLIAVGLSHTLLALSETHLGAQHAGMDLIWHVNTQISLTATISNGLWLTAALVCLGIGAFLSWRVDINLFSLYHFYRNRLVRCYLGASRTPQIDPVQARKPHPFTGFDAEDDIGITDLADQRPYPLVNTALNLVSGENLAWQQRKAAAFCMTPRYAGFDLTPCCAVEAAQAGFRPSSEFLYAGLGGLWLGSAVAISGAAASPNMGYHSTPTVAFLLTVFNVRLGHWVGNPLHETAWRSSGPGFGGFYLASELLGLTNGRTRYVYLSDGGHFENLGIYELVRRRCRYVVASDAGQDGICGFEDLGNAIRKCYTDFGVRIEIDVEGMRPDAQTQRSGRCYAVGQIHYPDGMTGSLIYLKPSLTDNTPADVLNYALQNTAFPHESTADQWFSEAQFESYRKLGYDMGLRLFGSKAIVERARKGESQTQDPAWLFDLVNELTQRMQRAPGKD
jgi:hypothetical protein